MDSFSKLQTQPLHLSLNPNRQSRPIPISPISFRTQSSPLTKLSSPITRASSSSSSSSKSLIFPILKTVCVTITAAAALFLSGGLALNPAIATPTATVEPAVEEGKKEKEGPARGAREAAALRELMEARLKAGKLLEAVEVLDRLIELEPEDMEWRLLKGQVYSFSGDPEAARRCFEGVLEKEPLRVEAYHGLLMANAEAGSPFEDVLKRIRGAMERCRKENRGSDLRDFKLLVAQVSVMEEKYSDALRLYEELVKEEPADFRPYLCQGIVYTVMRKKGEAERMFDQFRKLVPRNHPFKEYLFDNMFATKFMAEKVEREAAGSRS